VTQLRIAPEAEEELAAAAEWYETRRAGLGLELVAVIDRAFDAILEAPLSYAEWRDDRPYRRKVVERFPYVVFFTVEGDTVVVIAVAHARRRPGYWTSRGQGI
jgi:plasmid stabilization system protein ParE